MAEAEKAYQEDFVEESPNEAAASAEAGAIDAEAPAAAASAEVPVDGVEQAVNIEEPVPGDEPAGDDTASNSLAPAGDDKPAEAPVAVTSSIEQTKDSSSAETTEAAPPLQEPAPAPVAATSSSTAGVSAAPTVEEVVPPPASSYTAPVPPAAAAAAAAPGLLPAEARQQRPAPVPQQVPPPPTYGNDDHSYIAADNYDARPKPRQPKLTFSGPPAVHRAKAHDRMDMTFSKDHKMTILLENAVLVKKLTEVSQRKNQFVPEGNERPVLPCNTASSAVNRRKHGDTIAEKNLFIYQRLQAIKPSKDVSRDFLTKQHHQNEVYGSNCRRKKQPVVDPNAASYGVCAKLFTSPPRSPRLS